MCSKYFISRDQPASLIVDPDPTNPTDSHEIINVIDKVASLSEPTPPCTK